MGLTAAFRSGAVLRTKSFSVWDEPDHRSEGDSRSLEPPVYLMGEGVVAVEGPVLGSRLSLFQNGPRAAADSHGTLE